MAIGFYDEIQTPYSSDPLRASFDGQTGSIVEQLIHLRNDDSARYYTSVVLSYIDDGSPPSGEFGTTGWSVKFLYGTRRPTEAEWDAVRSGDSLNLPDIGVVGAGDTSTYLPVWVRIVNPGGEPAKTLDAWSLRVSAIPKLVV